MTGKYLRKRVPGKPQDPTMTHVDDPHAFKIGDVIRDAYGYYRIVDSMENVFDNPDLRFVYLEEIKVRGQFPQIATVHDVRENDQETMREYQRSLVYIAE